MPYWVITKQIYLIDPSLCIRGIFSSIWLLLLNFIKKIAIYGAIKIIFLGMCVAYVVHIQKIKDIFVISYKQMM